MNIQELYVFLIHRMVKLECSVRQGLEFFIGSKKNSKFPLLCLLSLFVFCFLTLCFSFSFDLFIPLFLRPSVFSPSSAQSRGSIIRPWPCKKMSCLCVTPSGPLWTQPRGLLLQILSAKTQP